jgi:mono/diheme cytochrome c family protein
MSVVGILLVVALVGGLALAVRLPAVGAPVVAVATVALGATIIASGDGDASKVEGRHGQTVTLTGAQTQGRQLFVANCSGCHALRAAGAVGQTGPDLDFLRPPVAVVERRVREGSQATFGAMPPALVTGPEAHDVAEFVAGVAGR